MKINKPEKCHFDEINSLVLATGEFTLEEIINGFLLIDSQGEKMHFNNLFKVGKYIKTITK